MLDLLTSSGNHRIARIGTVLSLPAVLAYPCACPHLGGAQRMLDLLTSSGNHRSAQVYYRSERGHMRARALRWVHRHSGYRIWRAGGLRGAALSPPAM